MQRSVQSNPLLTKNPLVLYLQYLFPSLCASLVIAGNYLIDTICVGLKIGEVGLAALNVVVPVTGLFYAMGFMFAFGASNLFSNRMGEGREKEARSYYVTATAVLAVIVLIVTVLGLCFNDAISILLCNGAAFHEQTAEYLLYVFWFAPFYCFESYYSVFVRNDNAPFHSMLGTVLDCSLNIFLDFLFVWELDMGMAGASLATGIALMVGTAVAFSATLRKSSRLKLWGSKIRLKLMKPILINGLPDFLREFSGSLVILVVNLLLLQLSGETAVAAYSVIANLANVVLCGLAGTSNAMQPLVSYCHGAGRHGRVKKLLVIAMCTSAILSCAYVALAELYPELLVRAFLETPTPQLSQICKTGIRIISPGYILAGLSTTFNVYAEAVHAPTQAFWISAVRGLLAPIACILLCVPLWGVDGVWLSFLLAEGVSFLIALLAYWTVTRKLKASVPDSSREI